MSFKITGALSTVSYSLFPNTLIPDSSTKLTFKVPATELTGDHKVTVSASGGGKTHEIKLDLKIVGDTTPPNLNTNFPVDNDKDVNVNSNITITFSKDMNKSSVESGFSISPNVTGTFIWDGNLKLIFTPTSDLEEGQTYKITISKDVKDLAGNALGEDKTFSFTTLEEDDGGGDDGYQTIIVIIIVIVVIFIIIAVLMRKKHK